MTHLKTSSQNVRERPKHNTAAVVVTIPNNMRGFRPLRSESQLKGKTDMVDAMVRHVICAGADEQTKLKIINDSLTALHSSRPYEDPP